MEAAYNSESSGNFSGSTIDGYRVLYPVQKVPNIDEFLCEVPDDQKNLIPDPNLIATKKYTTSIDKRNFITVYEYQVNNQWIIWDYHTGYVLLTGIWKAIGNNKADIVKLVEKSPELSLDLKRIRGGFLKIQGTWLPYEMVKKLARNFCYNIRYALIPIFGLDFPNLCLLPSEIGFGHLQLNIDPTTFLRNGPKSSNRRGRRKSNDTSLTLTRNRDILTQPGKHGATGSHFNGPGASTTKRVTNKTNKIIQKRRNNLDSSVNKRTIIEPNSNDTIIKPPRSNFSWNSNIESIKGTLESSKTNMPSLEINWDAIESDEDSGDDDFSINDKLYIENILTRRSSISGTLNSYKHLGSTSSALCSDYSYKVNRSKSYIYDTLNLGIDRVPQRRNSLPENYILTETNDCVCNDSSWPLSGFRIPPLPDLSHGTATKQISNSTSAATIASEEDECITIYNSKENNSGNLAYSSSSLSFSVPRTVDGSKYLNIKTHTQEFLEILKATKSLQQISLGEDDKKIPSKNPSNMGFNDTANTMPPSVNQGDYYEFEYDGQMWNWDGNEQLNLIEGGGKWG